MDAVINGDKRYVVFVNNGLTVNSPPYTSAALGRVVTSCVGRHRVDVGQP